MDFELCLCVDPRTSLNRSVCAAIIHRPLYSSIYMYFVCFNIRATCNVQCKVTHLYNYSKYTYVKVEYAIFCIKWNLREKNNSKFVFDEHKTRRWKKCANNKKTRFQFINLASIHCYCFVFFPSSVSSLIFVRYFAIEFRKSSQVNLLFRRTSDNKIKRIQSQTAPIATATTQQLKSSGWKVFVTVTIVSNLFIV